MAIFAHPDDEAFGTGGTLSKYAQEGVEVHLVMATLGQVGRLANPQITLNEPISVVRERELRCACEAYGIEHLHLLGYMDGQTTIAPQSEAVFKIVKLMRQYRPQVVMSFGPEGIYGHYDHLAVHRWVTAAVRLASDTERWAEAGLPYTVAKFYHRAMPEEQVKAMAERFGRSDVLMDGVPFPFIGYPMARITTVIDVRDYIQRKIQGIRCHASQVAPDSPFIQADFAWEANPGFWQETFILAHSDPNISGVIPEEEKEQDLFAGLR